MPDKHIYLDTNIIKPKLWPVDNLDELEKSSSIIGSLTGQVSNDECKVMIPHVVLGECIDIYLREVRRGNTDAIQADLEGRIEGIVDRLEAEIVSPREDAFGKAAELLERETELTDINDALIAGHAICDFQSEHLITTDGVLLNSREFDRMVDEQEGRHFQLSATEDYG